MRRTNPKPILDQDEVRAHLRPMRRPNPPRRFPLLRYDHTPLPYQPIRPAGQAEPPRGERYPVERYRLAAAQAAPPAHPAAKQRQHQPDHQG